MTISIRKSDLLMKISDSESEKKIIFSKALASLTQR